MRAAFCIFFIIMLAASCAPGAPRTTPSAVGKSTGGNAADQLPIQLDNELTACVELATEEVVSVRNVVVLGTRMRMLQSLAACGCKTALLGYRVRLDDPWRSGLVGRIDTNNRPLRVDEHVHLLLSTDAALLQQARTASISVSCKAADSGNKR